MPMHYNDDYRIIIVLSLCISHITRFDFTGCFDMSQCCKSAFILRCLTTCTQNFSVFGSILPSFSGTIPNPRRLGYPRTHIINPRIKNVLVSRRMARTSEYQFYSHYHLACDRTLEEARHLVFRRTQDPRHQQESSG
jgi:hypothetical protein